MSIQELVRPNILALKPYSSARHEFEGEAEIFLDANENPFETGLNRYPDPLQKKLKERIAEIKQVSPERIFLGNGSDEAIDLLIRIFCQPGEDAILTLPPTYGMYRVAADIAGVEVKEVRLLAGSQPHVEEILQSSDAHTKLLFLCSPNNPTGNTFRRESIEQLLREFQGITVLDEAYIDFSSGKSWLERLEEFPRLVVMQTFSKAWGMAGLRLGMAFASPEIISLFNQVKAPYNLNTLTQKKALEALSQPGQKEAWVQELHKQKALVQPWLMGLDFVERIFPSEANFLLVKMKQPEQVYRYLIGQGIVVRDRSRVALCEGCLRLTIGTAEENDRLMQALIQYQPEPVGPKGI
jgi:histidinol-phosphate aminotransferase